MSSPAAFTHSHGCWWRHDTAADTVVYLPDHLSPQLDPTDQIQALVVPLGERVTVQLAGTWSLPADELAALRLEAGPTTRLSMADVGPVPIALVLTHQTGDEPVAVAITSGYGSHDFILSVTATGDDRAELMAAIAGQAGHVALNLDCRFPQPSGTSEEVSITTDLASWFEGRPIHPLSPTVSSQTRKDPSCS